MPIHPPPDAAHLVNAKSFSLQNSASYAIGNSEGTNAELAKTFQLRPAGMGA